MIPLLTSPQNPGRPLTVAEAPAGPIDDADGGAGARKRPGGGSADGLVGAAVQMHWWVQGAAVQMDWWVRGLQWRSCQLGLKWIIAHPYPWSTSQAHPGTQATQEVEHTAELTVQHLHIHDRPAITSEIPKQDTSEVSLLDVSPLLT